jgi:hypothetical protein
MSCEEELKEWQDYFGCDSPHNTDVMDGTALGNEQMRNNILENQCKIFKDEIKEIMMMLKELLQSMNSDIERVNNLIEKIEDIGKNMCNLNCKINSHVGGDHAYCDCECHKDTFPAVPPSRERIKKDKPVCHKYCPFWGIKNNGCCADEDIQKWQK